jgi:hypothetical protein
MRWCARSRANDAAIAVARIVQLREQHRGPDEREDEREADLQVVEAVHHTGEQEEHRTQAEDREDVRLW